MKRNPTNYNIIWYMPIISLDTAPPKSILKPEMTLLDSKLTPRALLYFGTSVPEESKSYIKSSFTSTLTLPALASQAALQYRLAFSLTFRDENVTQ